MSLDGYIAKQNEDLTFLNRVEKAGEDYGYAAFTDTIDTFIIGRNIPVSFPTTKKQKRNHLFVR